MKIVTNRFGEIQVNESELVHFPSGLLGLPEIKDYALIDPADDTLILWLQSVDNPNLALPILEPGVFKPDYKFQLTKSELEELKLLSVKNAAVFTVLTIPDDITQMSANLKAPLVVNLEESMAKQVVLQESRHQIKYPMFKELRAHLMTISSNTVKESEVGPVSPKSILPTPTLLTEAL